MPTTACKNCSSLSTGNYCSNCGQPSNTHRIDAHYFLHDIPHSVLHIDKGFPYTFWQLVKRPAKSLQEYLDGKRVSFFKPLAYVVLMSAICAVVINWIRKWSNAGASDETVTEHASFFSHYPSLFIFLMIPIVSICTYLVFKKSHYNFWEHVLVNTYMAAQLNVLLVIIKLFLLLNLFTTKPLFFSLTLFMTGFMTYYAVTFSGLMHKGIKSWSLGLRLGIMCFVLASIYSTGIAYSGLLD